MKKHILFHHVWHFIVLALFITNISYTQPVPGGDAPPISPGKHFLHIATAGNSASNWTVIDNPYTNGNADAKLFISHNWNGSGSGVYNDHVSGLWYNGSNWTIFNEDAGIVPVVENSAYHILVADESQSTVFQHSAEAGNIVSNWTVLSHPELDGNPNARILVTQILISSAGNVYNNHEVGVWYDGSHWAIFNQDIAAMPVGASFNVLILNDDNSLLQTAVSGSISGATTEIDHPALNDNPNAIVYVTQNWNGSGLGGVYNTSRVSTYYSTSSHKWTIYNEDVLGMVENSKYNVYFGSQSFVHHSEAANISGNLTYFDNPLVNRDHNAMVFALHNWNPFGSGTAVYDVKLGVYHYANSFWGVFSQDASAMPEGLYFNVAVAPKSDSAFLHTSSASNIVSNYTIINNPLLNSNPNARILVQPQYVTSYNNVNVGLWYNGSKWTIFNQDASAMAEGKDFNVWLLNDDKSFVHNVDSASLSVQNNYTVFDNPLTNNNPDANILVTQLLNDGAYFDHVLGVWYYDVIQKWILYTEDGAPFTLGLKYNVYVSNSTGIPTSVEEENNPTVVNNFELQQNYPNPFNPTTQIRFSLAEQSQVTLKVYNILGKEIATLVNDVQSSGVHEVSFDGSGLASGVYFYTLQAGKFTETRKMILIK
ncbi:MAG TPA: T9SS type A sorting domain-containing protein [Ignavibacteriaceae bacterium]